MSNLTVAKTILTQLGGNKFAVMVGAKNFVGSENSLSFSFMERRYCLIRLNASSDLYDLEFFKINRSKFEKKVSANFQNIDCENLRSVFEQATGLATRLF